MSIGLIPRGGFKSLPKFSAAFTARLYVVGKKDIERIRFEKLLRMPTNGKLN